MRAICDLRRGNERKRLGLVAKVTLFACLIWGLRFVPSGCLAVYPGPVMNLSAVIEITEYPPRDCSFYMVSVLAEDAIKAAINDYRQKNGLEEIVFEERAVH